MRSILVPISPDRRKRRPAPGRAQHGTDRAPEGGCRVQRPLGIPAPHPPTPAPCRGLRGPLRWCGTSFSGSGLPCWTPVLPTRYTHPAIPTRYHTPTLHCCTAAHRRPSTATSTCTYGRFRRSQGEPRGIEHTGNTGLQDTPRPVLPVSQIYTAV